MHNVLRCKYCNRNLTEDEKFCRYCEQDVSKLQEEAEKPKCFIVGAVFGERSYEVMFLRNFKDDVLHKFLLGKIFIFVYYKISPSIARAVERNKVMKRFLRRMIRVIIGVIRKVFK